MITLVGIPGSLRRRSYNRLLLENARDLVPDGVRLEIVSVGRLPLYDQDLDTEVTPEPVARLREVIRGADGILIATPEYNYSVPGVLKNAIDWASRPYGAHVLLGKPIAIMGASSGAFGTVRAQMHWRQVFLFTRSKVVTEPEVYVGNAPDRFDGTGRLVDERSRQLLRELIENLVATIRADGRDPVEPPEGAASTTTASARR